MALPPSLRRITKEVLAGAPEWGIKLANQISGFMEQVGDGLSGNLTVSQNLAQCWVTLEVAQGQLPPPQTITLKNRAPYGLSVERVEVLQGGARPTSAVFVDWESVTINQADGTRVPGISILGVHGLASGTKARLRLLVKAE